MADTQPDGSSQHPARSQEATGRPAPGQAPLTTVVMVHGSSIGAVSSWDLNVPGAGEYSMMNVFARLGYDVWAIDFEGYGKSSVTSGNSDIKSGVADLVAAVPIIEAKLVKCPVLLARGQYDGIATEADILDFYSQLPNPDRQLVILPGLAHSLTLGLNRQLYWHVAHSFMSMPKAQLV